MVGSRPGVRFSPSAHMRALGIVLAILVIIGGVGLLVFFLPRSQPMSPQPTPITLQEDVTARSLSVQVIQTDEKNHRERLLVCERKICHVEAWPWFYYKDDQLVRQNKDGSVTTLVTKTPLVAPRDLFRSPDGKFLAYWLDNIHDKTKELSELWLYETETGHTRLLVENVVRLDVLTPPRWNSASTHLAYLANNGVKEQKKIELVVVQASPPQVQARFRPGPTSLWDISFTGRSLARAETVSAYRTNLTIIHDGSPPQNSSVYGRLAFLQWVEDGSLLYAVQDDSGLPAGRQGFTFWRLRSTQSTQLSRQPGELKAARSDPAGQRLVFVASQPGQHTLTALNLTTNLATNVAVVPAFGETLTIPAVHLRDEEEPSPANLSATLDDAELTAFAQQYLAQIAADPNARPQRVITTDQTNVIYIDYTSPGQKNHRLLITVRDAIHPEWSIRARYEAAGGEWQKTQGGGLADPKPVHVYEWEKDLNQWILKS